MALRPVDALFRLLLVLSMWHAPLPWLHQHEISGPQVVREAGLLKHVGEFHAEDAELGEVQLGWHVHLVLPWCLSHHVPCPLDHSGDSSDDPGHFGDGFKYAVASSASQTVAAASLSAAPFDGLLDAGDCLMSGAILHALDLPALAQNGAGHFLATYGRSVSICDLVGVCVC